jgi:hypothetical protein
LSEWIKIKKNKHSAIFYTGKILYPISIQQESISKSELKSFRVLRLYDIKNEIPSQFPGEETSLGSGIPAHLPLGDDHAHPSLLTVFSITQSDHSITLLSNIDITDLEMFPVILILLDNLFKNAIFP